MNTSVEQCEFSLFNFSVFSSYAIRMEVPMEWEELQLNLI